MRYALNLFLFSCGIITLGYFSSLKSYGAPKILIVNSYHQGLSWSDSIVAGFRSSVIKSHPTTEFYIEYIDSKRKPLTPVRGEEYFHYLMQSYRGEDLDLVFLTDDDAVNFWMHYGQEISPNTKVVFAGVNMVYDFPSNYCGLIEAVDFSAAFQLIEQTSPTAEQIYVVNDATTTGTVLTKQMVAALTGRKILGKITFLTGLSFSELKEKVAAIEPPDVIFFVLYNVDSHGHYLSYEATLDSMANFVKVPIFVPWEFYLGHGGVGGNLISPGLHGQEAGQMAVRVLAGEQPSEIGVKPGPTHNFFDYRVLSKTSIKRSDLPRDSIIINLPFAFVKQNRLLFSTLAVLFVLLLAVILSLIVGNQRKRERLKREEALVQALSDSQQGLVEAKRKAEEANRLKSSFLANMSHEIRSPMNGIVGFANLLKDVDRLSPAKRKTYVDIINANSRNLLTLITDILDISKIEANQLVLHPGPCVVNQLLADIFVFFSNEKARLGIDHLKLSYSQGVPEMDFVIHTDKDRLRQVLANLIGNSLKFTPEGNVEWGYTKEEGYLQFYVRDTGVGIDSALHQSIFDRFIQDGHSLTNTSGGVGLGLAICKALVEMLGGKIWLNSEVMGGTIFYFTVPIEYKAEKINSNITGRLPDWSGKQILIVDKYAASATELLQLLKPTLASIALAQTLKEAVRNYSPSAYYNFILFNVDDVDFDSPDFDDFLMRCAGKTPMIAYGNNLDEDAFALLQVKGFVFGLNYPVAGEQLVTAIRRFIN